MLAAARRCTATYFTRQQMADMGLLPPDAALIEKPFDDAQATKVVNGDGNIDGDARGDDDEPEAIGLIGHFEATELMGRKGKAGPFVGSLDMSMTKRDLISTEEGVGEMPIKRNRKVSAFRSSGCRCLRRNHYCQYF